jgi:hypothetical protein
MISEKDRSYYFGASDTDMIVGKWDTKTFEKWWLVKLGLSKNDFSTDFTKAGNNYEHKILESLEIPIIEMDKQIIINRLRVNLDGNTPDCIYEVKTHQADKEFKVSKKYWRQVQVEMYASGIKKAFIVAYGLNENDYKNYFNKIDKTRLSFHEIVYDPNFINNEYLPKLDLLTDYIERGVFPV